MAPIAADMLAAWCVVICNLLGMLYMMHHVHSLANILMDMLVLLLCVL